jgi:tight adherence protein C
MAEFLPLLRVAIIVQAVLLGGLLIYLAVSRDKARIAGRISKLSHALLKDNTADVPLPAWQAWLSQLALRDIPADQHEVLVQIARRFGAPELLIGVFFAGLRLAAMLALSGATYLLLLITVRAAVPAFGMIAFSLFIGMGGGIIGTRRLVATLSLRRREAVTRKIPYALELILIFLDSGLGLTNAFERVAEALEHRQPALHEELKATIADLRVLGSQDLAFKNMAERIDTPNMHSIVNILRQSIQYGSPISEAMHNALDLMRRTEILLLEEQANKLPSKITLITLLTIFPPFIIVLAGPAMIGLTSALTNF